MQAPGQASKSKDPLNLKGTRTNAGGIIYGPLDGNYIHISHDGRASVRLRDQSMREMRKAQAQNMRDVLLENGDEVPLVLALRQFTRSGDSKVNDTLFTILSEPTEHKTDILIDQFSSALKAARRLNWRDSNSYDIAQMKFIEAIEELATGLHRPPSRSELAARLGCQSSNVTKLCNATWFDWLPRANQIAKLYGNQKCPS